MGVDSHSAIELTPEDMPYEDGFSKRTIIGAIFVGLIMMPGSIYLSLVAGGGMGSAAEWVTIILFAEVAKRSLTRLSKQEMFILYYVAAGLAGGGAFADLVWRQYFIQSPQALAMGVAQGVPSWACPAPESVAITKRILLHKDWWIPIGLFLIGQVMGRLNWIGMGYILFRITSDVEKLAFPFAPITAEGATALAEATRKEESWRWPILSFGAAIGIIFGAIYIGVPTLTGSFMSKPLSLLPIPFKDLTPNLESIFPASLSTINFHLGTIFAGMVLPYTLVMGGCVGTLLVSYVLNPLFYHLGLLPDWHRGMGAIPTRMVTDLDIWLSVGVGIALAIASMGISSVLRTWLGKESASRGHRLWTEAPKGRGDISGPVAWAFFLASTACFVGLSKLLVPSFPFWIIFVFGFIWTPLHSYVSARMIGLTGNGVQFPYLRNCIFILSKYQGVDIWFAPIPISDLGFTAQRFKELELTGTKITSLLKAEALMLPIAALCSLAFWAFFWYVSAIPSASYPWATKFWPIRALYDSLFMTATSGGENWLFKALKPSTMLAGFAGSLGLFGVFKVLGVGHLFYYGLLGGLGGWPGDALLMALGAVLGKRYFAKRYGEKEWKAYTPILAAGFGCGMGLSSMISVAFVLVTKAVSALPF